MAKKRRLPTCILTVEKAQKTINSPEVCITNRLNKTPSPFCVSQPVRDIFFIHSLGGSVDPWSKMMVVTGDGQAGKIVVFGREGRGF